MDSNPGLDRREFIAGTVALGAAVAGDGASAGTEATMATATIDGLTVNYMTRGSGPPLLMLAPGGFDAGMERWSLSGVWKGMRPFETLSEHFTMIAYDRRESGASGGRVERLSWGLFADQAKALLDHLKLSDAYVLGGCMGCSVALAFAARYPQATRGLILHWPVGGYRWKINAGDRFARHARFARENKLDGVIKRAQAGKSFWADPEAGPWASVLVHDPQFAEAFAAQDLERYVGLCSASGRTLFDRDTAPGAEPEEIMGMTMPALIMAGDDPSHAQSAAHYLKELLPKPQLWPIMPPHQTSDNVRDRILEFRRTIG
jgi:pimeloyl-ACP methyl ester carboxylesterase